MSVNRERVGRDFPHSPVSASRLLAACVFVVCAACWAPAIAAQSPPDESQNTPCLNCHRKKEIGQIGLDERLKTVAPEPPGSNEAAVPAEAKGPRPGLYVPVDALATSVHAKLSCVDCHPQAAATPHARNLGETTCGSNCHPKSIADYQQGSHAQALARGYTRAPTCASCHGGHDIRRRTDPMSMTYPLNVVRICGDCHQDLPPSPGGLSGSAQVANYVESVHGKALVKGGLIVSANCANCHGNHLVLPAEDPRSPVHREMIPKTCGQCHAGKAEAFSKSIHAQKLAKGNTNAPICSNCHTSHSIIRTDTPAFLRDIVGECGECHNKPSALGGRRSSFYETYAKSYHGQVHKLGMTIAAKCSDCHGSHDILRAEDPQGRLGPGHRLETCRRCHKEASAGFETFAVHADPLDAKWFPLLNAIGKAFVFIMLFSFGFFGLHCLLWFVRQMIERVRHGPLPKYDSDPRAIKRFSRIERLHHAFLFSSFFGLALTGLPLLYADKAWGQFLCDLLGGPRSAGILHRVFAVLLLGNLLVHFIALFRNFMRYPLRYMLTGPRTLLPRWQDFVDCARMFRWFIIGGKRPTFDHWTYFEKFDYFAATYGSLVIGLSGLLLWFPAFFSQFLPGWAFNVAMLVHGHEAMLAIGYIFTIHFFNAHLRMEKFPVDDVIFTGRVSEEEFKHERGQEYARLAQTGGLEPLRSKPPARWFRRLAVVIAVVAMSVGGMLVTLIILVSLGLI